MKADISKKNAAFTLIEIMVVVIIIGLLAAIAIPLARKSQATAYQKNCMNNLRIIDQAKQQAALELRLQSNAVITIDIVTPFFQRAVPTCAAGGNDATFDSSYEIGDISIPAACKINPDTHKLPSAP